MTETSVTVTNDNPIVRVEPYFKSFIVHWLIGIRCNYNCSYCPDMWHSYTAKDKSLEELKQSWLKIREVNQTDLKQYELSFLGGENTLNKNFLPFLRWLHEEHKDVIANIGFITNGTASIKYYSEALNYCNWITFSTHSEFMNEDKFFRTITKVNELARQTNCSIKVNIMDEPWHQDKIQKYKNYCDTMNIDNYLHPIRDFNEGKARLTVPIQKVDFFNDKLIQKS
jgi:pyruvate-formate lyase-activating enzyme